MNQSNFVAAIVGLSLSIGVIVGAGWRDLGAISLERRITSAAEHNLLQAEQKMVACIESRPFSIGSAIYVPTTRLSELTVEHVGEL